MAEGLATRGRRQRSRGLRRRRQSHSLSSFTCPSSRTLVVVSFLALVVHPFFVVDAETQEDIAFFEPPATLRSSSSSSSSSPVRSLPIPPLQYGQQEDSEEEDATTVQTAHNMFSDPIFLDDETPTLADDNNNNNNNNIDMDVILLDNDPLFSDPRYDDETWSYDMIRLPDAWSKGYTGAGIRVRINDNGVRTTHMEFAGRFDWDASCPSRVEPETPQDSHGTAVAGIVAAAGNNNECAVGIAPQAILSACYALSASEAFLGHLVDQIDVSQNSYERPACTRRRRRNLQTGQFEYEEDDDELIDRNLQECPFVVLDPNTNPCDICYSTTNRNLQENNNNNDRTPCESQIIRHCQRHYENDVLGCSEFLDLFLDNGSCTYGNLSETARIGIINGITIGRNGKGVVYVFASGNAYDKGDITTIKGYTNTRYTITVGAVGRDERHASYSTPGASVFVTAPGGDVEQRRNHISTLALEDDACGYIGIGTSYACPVVSGVVALMLEANSELTWRDVQGILAMTSRPKYDERDTTATLNGAGYWHSNLYGFGIVNAGAAVAAAERIDTPWFGSPERMWVTESGRVDLPITDDPTTTTVSTITVTEDIILESVAVYLDVQHLSRGDMDIVLTSPSGTQSLLHPGKRPENTQLGEDERWKLLTVRNWGESSVGEWTLSLTDVKAGEFGTGCTDAPFFIIYTNVAVYCDYLEEYSLCADGAIDMGFFGNGDFDPLLATEDKGRTLEEACCACGGGLTRDSYPDMLRQWTIVLYGRDSESSPSPTEDLERFGTPAPTKEPTTSPTGTPTRFPTTAAPTKSPTSEPTESPTEPPTENPSAQPTLYPSTEPTMHPSIRPTQYPSDQPIQLPSTEPTRRPSFRPSTSPTNAPTTVPSTHPTSRPTAVFSTAPSRSPTENPTKLPSTAAPSELASKNPTRFPTLNPSTAPSPPTTISPSIPPTREPTLQPSRFPTVAPADDASATPSQSPTESSAPPTDSGETATESGMNPGEDPSSSPTTVVTTVPSESPTPEETLLSSEAPTNGRYPSSAPSTSSPIAGGDFQEDSRMPTHQPSSTQSRSPSHLPTQAPLLAPIPATTTPVSPPPTTQSPATKEATPSPSYIPSMEPPTIPPSGAGSSTPTLASSSDSPSLLAGLLVDDAPSSVVRSSNFESNRNSSSSGGSNHHYGFSSPAMAAALVCCGFFSLVLLLF